MVKTRRFNETRDWTLGHYQFNFSDLSALSYEIHRMTGVNYTGIGQ